MKVYIFSFFLALALLVTGFSFMGRFTRDLNNAPASLASQSGPAPAIKLSPSPAVGLPQTLQIPSIKVTASVELVGLDNQGRMDVPKNVQGVGWYSYGARPGEKGNAVIDGHLDSETGPAVFYHLGKIRKGDKIFVTDSNGKKLIFEVTDKRTFAFDQVPLDAVFGEAQTANLNLITCEGVFDRLSKNYSQRVVVYSSMVER